MVLASLVELVPIDLLRDGRSTYKYGGTDGGTEEGPRAWEVRSTPYCT